MTKWAIIFAGLLLGILLGALFISLGSKNWAKNYWDSLKFISVFFVAFIVIASVAAFSMIVLGKNQRPISIGIMFALSGLAMVLGAPFIDRKMTIIGPPRLQEMAEILGTAGQGRKRFRILGLILILIGLPFFFTAPFLRNQDATVLLGWVLLVFINTAAGIVIVWTLITAFRMTKSYPEIARADRDVLMSLWPPVVIPLLGPPRAENWEQFKRRLAYLLNFRIRDAFALLIPQQKGQRIAWLGFIVLFIATFFFHHSRSSVLFDVLKSYKLSLLAFWSIALLVAYYVDAKIHRKFMAALQARVIELDSLEFKSGRT